MREMLFATIKITLFVIPRRMLILMSRTGLTCSESHPRTGLRTVAVKLIIITQIPICVDLWQTAGQSEKLGTPLGVRKSTIKSGYVASSSTT